MAYFPHFKNAPPSILAGAAERLQPGVRYRPGQLRRELILRFKAIRTYESIVPRPWLPREEVEEEEQEASDRRRLVTIDALDKQLQKYRYYWYASLPSLPLNQFLSQATREAQRLRHQEVNGGFGRRQTLWRDQFHALEINAENNVRCRWEQQGIWAEAWGPGWAENADTAFELDRQVRKGRKDAPDHPFKDLRWKADFSKPFPNSWGHETVDDDADVSQISWKSSEMPSPDVGPPEKLVPKVRNRQGSMPLAQFTYQVASERDWIQDERDWIKTRRNWNSAEADIAKAAESADLVALARASVRENWIVDGIWRREWDDARDGLPFGLWHHEMLEHKGVDPAKLQPPLEPNLPWEELVRLMRDFRDGKGIDTELTRADVIDMAMLCGVRPSAIRAACAHPVTNDDQYSGSEEDVDYGAPEPSTHSQQQQNSASRGESMAQGDGDGGAVGDKTAVAGARKRKKNAESHQAADGDEDDLEAGAQSSKRHSSSGAPRQQAPLPSRGVAEEVDLYGVSDAEVPDSEAPRPSTSQAKRKKKTLAPKKNKKKEEKEKRTAFKPPKAPAPARAGRERQKKAAEAVPPQPLRRTTRVTKRPNQYPK